MQFNRYIEIEINRAVIFLEIPRNSSLILEEKENLKKILEEKKIPCFRPLILSGYVPMCSVRDGPGKTQFEYIYQLHIIFFRLSSIIGL